MARNSKLSMVLKNVNLAHGKGTIGGAKRELLYRISTGSVSFDRALGGGIPVGRTTIFRGGESSGKTDASYRIIGIAQKLCANCYREARELKFVKTKDGMEAQGFCDCYKQGIHQIKQQPDEKKEEFSQRKKLYEENSYEEYRVALIEPERSWDSAWAETKGVNVDRLLYSCPECAEEAGDIYDELLRTGEIDMIVLDSIAALTPAEEIVESLVKWQQGLQARIIGKFTRRVQSSVNVVVREYGRLPTQLWINQEREKIGISFGDNTVMPAGVSQLFAASVIVKMWQSKWVKEARDTDLIKEFQSDIGSRVRINFKVTKNKTAPAYQTGSYDLWVAGEDAGKIDEQKYFLAMAEKFGLIKEVEDKKKKTWFLGDEEYKTKKAMIDRVMEPEVYKKMREMLMEALLVN